MLTMHPKRVSSFCYFQSKPENVLMGPCDAENNCFKHEHLPIVYIFYFDFMSIFCDTRLHKSHEVLHPLMCIEIPKPHEIEFKNILEINGVLKSHPSHNLHFIMECDQQHKSFSTKPFVCCS